MTSPPPALLPVDRFLHTLDNVSREGRQLRNRLIREYLIDSAAFAADLLLLRDYRLSLVDTYNRVRDDAAARLGLAPAILPRILHVDATEA